MGKLTIKKNLAAIPSQQEERTLPLLARRQFLGVAGSSLGLAMLGGLSGCGGGGSSSADPVVPASSTGTAAAADPGAVVVPGDPIWGSSGSAGKIISSLQGIKQGMFKNVDFAVEAYGATTCSVISQANYTSSTQSTNSDKTQLLGSFDSRPAFTKAIAACNAAGGGRVVVPAGNWYCAGPIVLLSNVNFHLSANCTIYFSQNPADYAKDGPVDCGANGKLYYSRWQACDCINYGSPIYARNQTNIAITGEDPLTSILNGQAMTPITGGGGTCWWSYKGTANGYGFVTGAPSQVTNNALNLPLMTMNPALDPALLAQLNTAKLTQDETYLPALSEASVPVAKRIFGKGHYLRPCMVEFIDCTNVLMEGYQTNNTPFWQMHPVHCTNVVIRNVRVESMGYNNDGFDPEACTNVLCDGMVFNTGDDCIAIKSGKNLDTQYGPAQDHVIQNCIMNSGHGGITFGSEMGAGIQNVYARNLMMTNAYWATDPLNIAIRIKTNMNRGGFVKNVYIDGVSLPNGVFTTGKGASGYDSNSPIKNNTVPVGVVTAAASRPSTGQGGVITFDCDYSPASDMIRSRPPVVQNFNISNVKVSNNATGKSCFQAVVAQGPVAYDYNGPSPMPTIYPISGVTISDCDFGTPASAGPASATVAGPIYAFNVNSITLKNVTIAGTVYNSVITDIR